MNIFVTGAEGFVGKRLVARLKDKGVAVTAVDIVAAQGSSTVIADITSRQIGEFIPKEWMLSCIWRAFPVLPFVKIKAMLVLTPM